MTLETADCDRMGGDAVSRNHRRGGLDGRAQYASRADAPTTQTPPAGRAGQSTLNMLPEEIPCGPEGSARALGTS